MAYTPAHAPSATGWPASWLTMYRMSPTIQIQLFHTGFWSFSGLACSLIKVRRCMFIPSACMADAVKATATPNTNARFAGSSLLGLESERGRGF